MMWRLMWWLMTRLWKNKYKLFFRNFVVIYCCSTSSRSTHANDTVDGNEWAAVALVDRRPYSVAMPCMRLDVLAPVLPNR